jgi:hypothetical protein
MEFAIVECVNRSFEDVCAELGVEPAGALRAAAGGQLRQLQVEAGPLAVLGPAMAVVHAAWRDQAGALWLETELRVVGLTRGVEPTTELLMIGRSASTGTGRAYALAWARTMLAELADQRSPAAWSLVSRSEPTIAPRPMATSTRTSGSVTTA